MTVDTNMTKLYEQFSELKTIIDTSSLSMKSLIKTSHNEILKELFSELKKIEGFNKLAFKGYTPSFNDGDPCTHTGESFYVCTESWSDFEDLVGYSGIDYHEFLNLSADFDYDNEDGEMFLKTINSYSEENEVHVSKLVYDIHYIIDMVYHTNYFITIDFEPEEPVMLVNDYYVY